MKMFLMLAVVVFASVQTDAQGCGCLDLSFIVDSNDAIWIWEIYTNFMNDIVVGLEDYNGACPNEIAIAPITYADTATLRWNILHAINVNTASITANLETLARDSGTGHNLVAGMNIAINDVFSGANDRPKCKNAVVIIANAEISPATNLATVASSLGDKVDIMYCVAFTNQVNQAQLTTLCGSNVEDSNGYSDVVDAIKVLI